jgi:uncharacterized Zn-binding protein involved in type VI secretion
MAQPVLTITTPVLCQHGGKGQAILTSEPQVLIEGQPVVVLSNSYAINGCPLAPTGSPFCVLAQWIVGAVRVMANGMPVLLANSQAVCVPTRTSVKIAPLPSRVMGE